MSYWVVTLACLSLLAACAGDAAGTTGDAATRHDAAGDRDANLAPNDAIGFTRHQLTDQFFAEGAAFADFDQDGVIDVVSGPFVYRGPDFVEARRYRAGPSGFRYQVA